MPASSLGEISELLPDEAQAGTQTQAAPDSEPTPAEPLLAPPFLSLREAAEWLGVSRSTLKRLIAKGHLISIRVGARQKIPGSYLATYVAREILLPNQIPGMEQDQ